MNHAGQLLKIGCPKNHAVLRPRSMARASTIRPFAQDEIPTAQEVFDRAARHLLTQMCMASAPAPDWGCVYRTDGGLACAVGCMLTDDFAREADGRTVRGVSRMDGAPAFVGEHIFLLDDPQVVHDTSGPSEWARSLRSLAVIRGLSTAVIDEMEAASADA